MIERIQGTCIDTDFTYKIFIETASGLTYGVSVPKELTQLVFPCNVYLFTHLVIKEDAHDLYGFSSMFDKIVFQKLISVSGLGPKSALSMISNLGVPGLIAALVAKDAVALARTPGIGKKTAEKTIIELHKFGTDHRNIATNTTANPLYHEAFEALVSLGYQEASVKDVLSAMEITEVSTLSQVIRDSMKNLSKK